MGRGESNGQLTAPSRQQPSAVQIANRQAGPPMLEEAKAALYSDSDQPRVATKYGIPASVINEAREFAGRYHSERAMLRRLLEYLYPAGTRVRLEEPMTDEPQPPSVTVGDEGTIRSIDDAPNIGVDWDSGSKLNLITGVDQFSVVDD